METLQSLAIATLMSLFKDLDCWEDVEDELWKMPNGYLLWPMEEELKKEWAKQQLKKKKALFKNVHQQLVSSII